MFHTLLIANRGEIACRIIRTARRLGLRTVAVYSEADHDAAFVHAADQAYCIGAAPASESYLRGDAILDVARVSHAQAIHPGYGFLSENARFAAACHAAGIAFVGPPVEAIAAMGSKSAAKTLMESAGVPLVPGYHGDEQAPEVLAQYAARIGYPVLIKASAGGGGKGMRIVESAPEFAAALASCQREALASFSDARVLVEKYLTQPRHIEIQVFADTHGNVIYLAERDCSVQRRHQKVLEEAPAPGLSAARRVAMGEAACRAARAVGYVGAGTVEFIVDTRDDAFYFMEMNTRLQVEHPVTEMITGLDLVEWQLRVAAGERLALTQEQVTLKGHAIEARIYAEDPERGFLPSTGPLSHLVAPLPSCHVRIDSGVVEGDIISPYYDPMIAKLIVWDETREAALQRLDQALSAWRVVGVTTNIDFLRRIVRHPAFASADLDTGLIPRHHDALFPAPCTPSLPLRLAALAFDLSTQTEPADSMWHHARGWRLNANLLERYHYQHATGIDSFTVEWQRDGGWHIIEGEGEMHTLHLNRTGQQLTLHIDQQRLCADVYAWGDERHVYLDDQHSILLRIDPDAPAPEHSSALGHLRAPMPGKVVALLASVGERVAQGTPLFILEAMKMEHTVNAPVAGTVSTWYCRQGEQVEEGAELLDFTPETEGENA